MRAYILHMVIIAGLLLNQQYSFAQHADFDTNYISRFDKRNLVELYPGISSTRFKFTNPGERKNDYSLVANKSGNIGIYLAYKWVSLKYSWAIPGTALDKDVKLQYTSLGFNFGIKRWAIKPFYNAYNGLLIPERPGGRDFTPARDIKFKDAGIDVFYFLHTRRFSIKAANSFTEKQIRAAGSAFLKFTPMWQEIKWEKPSHNVITDSTTYQLLAYNPEWFSVIMRMGYTYNFSFRKGRWSIAPTLIIGTGVLKELNTGVNHLQLVTDVQASLRAGHNGRNYYYYVNAKWGNLQTNLFIKNMTQVNTSISLTIGRRFGSLKDKIFGFL